MTNEKGANPEAGTPCDRLPGEREAFDTRFIPDTQWQATSTELTVVSAIKPSRLSKGFQLSVAGELITLKGGVLAEGRIETRAITSLHDLAEVLAGLNCRQALIHGVPKNTEATIIMTKDAFADAGRPAHATPRTAEAFEWPAGAGVMMLDYDPRPGADPLSRAGLVLALHHAVPAFVNAAMLWWPSASSCIYAADQQLQGIRGQRLYLLVKDAADIPRAGQVLFDRLWLAEYGYIAISRSGSMMERTLVDAGVWQTNRLDFAGGADCGSGLEQRRGQPVMIKGEALPIDMRAALPELTSAEREALNKIKQAARADKAVQEEAATARQRWIDERAADILKRLGGNDDAAHKAAERMATRALECGELAGHYAIHVLIEGREVEISVADILADPERFHGCKTLDPIEPEYDHGRAVGRLYLMQGRPTLYSFARGGKTYKLQRAPERLELVKGHIAEAAEGMIELLRKDPIIFDFGGQLVIAADGRVVPMCENLLGNHLPTLAQFWAYERRGDAIFKADRDPPAAMLKQILAKGEMRRLKPLDAVITGPTIRLDGTLLARPGYDASTRLLLDPLGQTIPDIPDTPTIEEADLALAKLWHPFKDFPLVDEGARGALLAALLTAAVRGTLPTSPAFAFDAPVQGSGKTLLALCIGALMTGRAPDVWPHTAGRDDEETRKRLFTALRTGSGALIWDNVTGVFDSAAMAAFITAPAMIDRILGKSEASRIPNRAMLVLTGNNLTFAGDLPRRIIICRIDPASATPFDRQFELDPLDHVLANRAALLAAACTLIRARYKHWTTPAPGRLASFEQWDDLVRQTVCFANSFLNAGSFSDPMELVREAQAADPEAETLVALLDAIGQSFQTREFSANNVLAEVAGNSNSELGRVLRDIAGDKVTASARSIGRILKFREGRIANHMCIRSRRDSHASALKFRLEIVQ